MQKPEHIFTVSNRHGKSTNTITGKKFFYFRVTCSCKTLDVDASEDQVGVIMRIHLDVIDSGET